MFASINEQRALPELSFSSINIRSLNLSNTTRDATMNKLNMIASKGYDIIALSEVKF